MIFNGKRNPNSNEPPAPYEAPINVRQIANLPYGKGGAMADYFEPMALTRSDDAPDKSALRLAVVFYDDPYEGTRADVVPLAMELARRGMAVYALGLSHAAPTDEPFFTEQLNSVFEFLADLAADKHRLDLRCRRYGASQGNRVVFVGCGTGATLASLCMRMHYNARLREYFAARCPAVRAYFGMGATPTVDFQNLIRIGGFVSVFGNLRPLSEANIHVYDGWFGRGFERTKLASLLDAARWVDADYPPMILLTSSADPNREGTLSFRDALPREVSCRLLDLPSADEEGHVLARLFNVRYPLWEISRSINSQLVSICKEWGD